MHDATVPTRIALDDGPTIDVRPVVDHVEITTIASGRVTLGLALDRTEARRLAEALLDASAPAFGHTAPREIDEHVAVARKARGLEHTSTSTTSYGREDLHSRDFGPYVTVHQLETVTTTGATLAPCEVEVKNLGESFLSADDAHALSRDLSRAAQHATEHDHTRA